MRIGIVSPQAGPPPTGASAYVAGLVAGWRAHGHEVVARPAMDAEDALTIIDGAALHAAALPDAARAVALVHHPFGGRDDAARERETAALRTVRVIATDPATAARLGLPAERIGIVPAGVGDLPRSLGPRSDGPCDVLSVAPLVRRHEQDVLLRALARLPDLDWTLTLAGAARDPDYARELSTLAADLGVAARVRCVAATDDAGMAALWDHAGCFARATRFERRPPLLLEALRRGLPVALAAEGEAAAFVPPEAGILVAPGDHADLSKALRRIVFDAGLRHLMADAAAAFGATLPDWPTQAALFLETVAALELPSG